MTMKLEHELYTIIENAENSVRIRLRPESEIFKAHFPDNPVTPGVCQVGIIEELAGKICDFRLFLKEVKLLKYTDILRPSKEEVEIRFDRLEVNEDGVIAKGLVMSDGRVFTKFSLIFGKEA